MRLIDVDALKETIHRQHYRLSNAINTTDHGMFTVGIDQAIDEQPTIDAVPVVRCKDCKRFEPHCNGKAGLCPKRHGVARADDFCSYGERKDGDV